MGVYIKDMKMPKTCYDCPLRKRNGINIVCPVVQERFSVADVNILFYRLDSCPLVPVPSHGRLIDADALHNAIAANIIGSRCGEETSVEIAINEAIIDDLMIIDAQQTIIPAEEGGA